jgi:metal-responsive CopG/Arc/MetJ family transcriptional regulator
MTKTGKPGKDSQHIGLTVEKDLVQKIDELARRDCISRSTWIREAMIAAWRESREFKRTPLHGYIAHPITEHLPAPIQSTAEPDKRQNTA